MKKLLEHLKQALTQGDAVLVTVTASSGSTPRGAGARMLVTEQGLIAGTIGGGAVEYRCIAMARQLLHSPQPVQHSFALNRDDTAGLGMVCGGLVQVHFLPIPAGDPGVLALCRDAAARFASGGQPFWLLTPLDGGALSLWPEGPSVHGEELPAGLTAGLTGEPAVRTADGRSWFVEQLQRPGAVYIFGGGHVAQALVPVLIPLDFPCVVLEDRAEFADPALFPGARAVRLVDFSRLADEVSLTDADYVCIMTRGHENDLLIEQQVLRMPARYIGLIGSARKAASSFAALRKMGFSEAELRRIVTPIGLPIGGKSPQEIAISIAAQLIQYRSGLRRDDAKEEVLS